MFEKGTEFKIIMYHYVKDNNKGRIYNKLNGVTTKQLVNHIKYMSGKYMTRLNLLSFDDGTKDHYENVLPILKKYGVNAMFSIPTKQLIEPVVLQTQKLQLLLATQGDVLLSNEYNNLLNHKHKGLFIKHKVDEVIYPDRKHWYRDFYTTITSNFKWSVNSLPKSVKEKVVNVLFETYFDNEKMINKQLYMNKREVKKLSNLGMEIALHGHEHIGLFNETEKEIEKDYSTAKDILEDITGKKIEVCVYPFGRRNNKSDRVLKRLGIKYGINVDYGINRVGYNNLNLNRVDAYLLQKEMENARKNS